MRTKRIALLTGAGACLAAAALCVVAWDALAMSMIHHQTLSEVLAKTQAAWIGEVVSAKHLGRIFHTLKRRVRARGLQERNPELVGRVPSRGAVSRFRSGYEICGLKNFP